MSQQTQRRIVKLSEIGNSATKTFTYSRKFSGSNKYGEYIGFANDVNVLFISEDHKAFEAAKATPPTGTLTIEPHISNNGRTYFTIKVE